MPNALFPLHSYHRDN